MDNSRTVGFWAEVASSLVPVGLAALLLYLDDREVYTRLEQLLAEAGLALPAAMLYSRAAVTPTPSRRRLGRTVKAAATVCVFVAGGVFTIALLADPAANTSGRMALTSLVLFGASVIVGAATLPTRADGRHL